MPNYTFTPEALDDLQKIVRYTVKEWGKSQAKTYVENLQLIAARIADNPMQGKNRSELRKGLYSFPYANHSLFYTETLKGIVIVRVLHKKMDIPQQF
jgi:toxin ParE1/3/4